jgi:hypothetical protein
MIWGDRDTISPVERSIEAARGAFAGSRSGLLTVVVKPGLDHNLYESETGGPLEENRIQRISDYMDDVYAWLQRIGVLDSRSADR